MGPMMDNGEAFMRAQRDAQTLQNAANAYQPFSLASLGAYLPQTRQDPPMAGTPGEREAEDVTGLRLLEEFLTKRKEARKE